MFFIAGVSPRRKELDYNKLEICDVCGSYGRYEVFLEYQTLKIGRAHV